MTVCQATPDSHCCWVGGQVCRYFDPAGLVDGRDGACTLRTELGSWAKVHTDPRYINDVRAHIPEFTRFKTYDCGTYPQQGVTCGECGVSG